MVKNKSKSINKFYVAISLFTISLLLMWLVPKSQLSDNPTIANTTLTPTQFKTQTPTLTEKKPIPTPKILPVEKLLSTENWKIYTNKVHHYTIKYPSDWQLDSSNADNFEDYLNDCNCCNSSYLKISKGNFSWQLVIDGMFTGGDPGQEECSIDEKCYSPYHLMDVFGHKLVRVTGKSDIDESKFMAFLCTYDKENQFPVACPIFTEAIGYKTTCGHKVKVFSIEYSGSNQEEIEEYLPILDTISVSLKKN